MVKIGSSVISPSGKIDAALIGRLACDIIFAESRGYKIILVSSGAISCGLNKLNYKKKPQDIISLMAVSSLGQIQLMDNYSRAFKKYKKLCAQILLTWDDFDNRKRFLNAKGTIGKLLEMGIIPIINENDAVSFEEIRFGENDRLSALVADLVSAELLVILSDVEGLMKDGKVVERVEEVNDEVFSLINRQKQKFTAGGMASKLEAVKIASLAGVKTVLACGRKVKIISRILEGDNAGTVFMPLKKVSKARKRWIAFGKKAKGKIYIDDGAKDALIYKGKSLLAVGVIKLEGDFKNNDAVEVIGKDGALCGCGIINYSRGELDSLKGRRLEREVIHRDNFVRTRILADSEECE